MNKQIKRAKDGSYYFRISLGFDERTGKRVQKYCSGFKTQKEAQVAYSKLLLDVPEEIVDEREEMRFKEYLDIIFLPWYKTRVKEQTYDTRVSGIKKNFVYFNKMKLSMIEPIDIQKWQVKLSKTLSSSYLRNVQGILSMALERAVVLGLIEGNPAKKVGNVKKQKQKVDFWTKEEFEKVISVIFTDDYYQHYLFISLWLLFMTGMRIGEASALQWSDIDFDDGTVRVVKTLNYKNVQNFSFGETKTAAGRRTIALDAETLLRLKKWKELQTSVVNADFVLSYNGLPTNKHTMSHAVTRFAKAAGVHRIKVHALRHSHASLLISMGENPIVIKERLGHEDIETTLGTYGHLYPNSNYEVASKLNGILQFQPALNNKVSMPKNQFTSKI